MIEDCIKEIEKSMIICYLCILAINLYKFRHFDMFISVIMNGDVYFYGWYYALKKIFRFITTEVL